MRFLNKINFRTERLWKWLLFILLPSALPIIVTLSNAMNSEPKPLSFDTYINVNDMIFLGISMAISNISALRGNVYNFTGGSSIIFLGCLMICIVLYQASGHLSKFMETIAWISALLTTALSFRMLILSSSDQFQFQFQNQNNNQ
jgi:hypothetical protein